VLLNLFKTMRPRQWTKNLIIYLPFLFTLRQYWQPFTPEMYSMFATATVAFVLFCILSGVIYLVNDLVDIEKDQLHPTKRFRPLASGALSKTVAQFAIVFFLVVGLTPCFLLDFWLGTVALIYVATMLLYSFLLKNIVIVDVFALAAGLVLRALAGAAAIHVPASPWLYACTVLLALYLGISKRRHELVLLEEDAVKHRLILKEYTPEFLDEMISVTTASFVMAYSLYTFSAPNLPKEHQMMLTIPFALYVVFRLLYLVHVKNMGGSPEEMVLRDKPLFGALVAWGIVAVGILFMFGNA
jgi:4-hydroxybenzoate polyprenyltransferase